MADGEYVRGDYNYTKVSSILSWACEMQMYALSQGLDWFWEMLKLVLASAVPPGRDLPRIIFSEHLSHLSRDTWLGFETAIVVHTRYPIIGKALLE